MTATAGFEPVTFRTKGAESTNELLRPTPHLFSMCQPLSDISLWYAFGLEIDLGERKGPRAGGPELPATGVVKDRVIIGLTTVEIRRPTVGWWYRKKEESCPRWLCTGSPSSCSIYCAPLLSALIKCFAASFAGLLSRPMIRYGLTRCACVAIWRLCWRETWRDVDVDALTWQNIGVLTVQNVDVLMERDVDVFFGWSVKPLNPNLYNIGPMCCCIDTIVQTHWPYNG